MRDLDYQDSLDFLSRFFEGTTETIEIRALPNERDAGVNRPLFTRLPNLVRAHCVRWDALERAVYFGIATRRSGPAYGDREHVCELPALYTDTDAYKLGISKEDIAERLLSLPIPPGVLVDSGGGIHGYWLLAEPIDVRQSVAGWPETELAIVSALRQLAGVVGGDNIADLPRVMRLPGTHNTKLDAPRLVSVLPCSTWARVEFGDIVDMLDTQRPLIERPLTNGHAAHPVEDNPYLAAARSFMFSAPIDVERRLADMSYLGNGESGIHATQLSVSASLVAAGADDDVIVNRILAATHAAAGPLAANWNWTREEAALRKMVESAKPKFAPGAHSATVHQLRAGGPKPAPTQDEPDDDPAPAGEQVRNDIGNAFALIEAHGPNLRYVLGIGWHVWDGTRYAIDPEQVNAQRMAHEVSAAMLESAARQPASKARTSRIKWAVQSGNKSRINAMLDQAKSYLHSRSDDLDADPMQLNCPNGTVDLANIELRPHEQSNLLTKCCVVAYDPDAKCPIWERFISEIFDGNQELMEFVQRAIGYSLTGRTDEQVIFIMHGAGSNGKSVLTETIAAILADYVKRSPAETWVSKPYSGASNDIAALAGARFVSVIETEHDKNLAEALVKQATGGDAMTARFLHREFFSFLPKFKLWFATNHKPRIRGSDYAIWRRILLVPFAVTFADAEALVDGQKVKDPDLKNKLLAEYPGILAWMIRGCAAWQTLGLAPPIIVRNATEGYQDSEDNVSAFIRDNCHVSRGITCEASLLYAAYTIWCEENDEEPRKKNAFGRNLEERGYSNGPRTNRARLRKGIDIKEEYRFSAEQRRAQPRADQ